MLWDICELFVQGAGDAGVQVLCTDLGPKERARFVRDLELVLAIRTVPGPVHCARRVRAVPVAPFVRVGRLTFACACAVASPKRLAFRHGVALQVVPVVGILDLVVVHSLSQFARAGLVAARS